jgi:hypothetical protein
MRLRVRTAAGASVLSVATLVLVASPAVAKDATTTTVTAVSGPQFRQYDADTGSPAIEVQGKSNGDASGQFDLRCYTGHTSSAYVPLASAQSFAADGSFDVLAPADAIIGRTCVVRAIPRVGGSSTSPTSFTATTGPLIGVGKHDVYASYAYSSSDLSGGQPYGYELDSAQRSGDLDWNDPGQCGLARANPVDPSGTPDGNPETSVVDAGCSAALPGAGAMAPSTRSAVQVDGVNALLPFSAKSVNESRAPALTVTATHDPDTGDQVITDSEPVVSCANPTSPPTHAGCATYSGTGVRLDRVVTQGSDGRVASVRDSFVSTDGKAHTVDLMYRNTAAGSGVGFRIPWSSAGTAYVTRTSGETVGAAPRGPATISTVVDASAAPSLTNPATAWISSVAPTGVRFTSGTAYFVSYTRTVPAGGQTALTQTFAQATTQGELDGYIASTLSDYQHGLTASLAGVPATIGSRQLTVHGTFAGGPNGLPGQAQVAVGAAPPQVVPVTTTGAFSATVSLQPGMNTVVVTGSDDSGLTATTSSLITFANPVTISTTKVSRTTTLLRGRRIVRSEKVVDTVSCAVFAAAPCRAQLLLTIRGHIVARRTVVLALGARKQLALNLNQAVLARINRLRAGRHLDATLTALFTDPAGGTLRTPSRNARLA